MEVRLKEDFREEWSKCLFCKTQKHQKASSKINAAEESNNKKIFKFFPELEMSETVWSDFKWTLPLPAINSPWYLIAHVWEQRG